jgi:DNA-binding GntR family transcriptional regulator
MYLHLSLSSSTGLPKHRQITAQIRPLIASGRLTLGDELPR